MLRKLRTLKYLISAVLETKLRQQLPAQLIHTEIERLRSKPCYQQEKSLVAFGYKIYSQNDEDGIIREIFNRIGVTNKVFVEIGIGNGLENNTLALLFDNWQGLWIEASTRNVEHIKKNFTNVIEIGQLTIANSFVTKENINAIISATVDHEEIDLLSIDIDGNDFHIFHSITTVKPRVVLIEYNAKFPPPYLFCMDYDESHVWQGDDCFGASLKFLEINFEKKGYYLVGCNLTGMNAFFVRKDLVADKFLKPFSAENHYVPARYFLSGFSAGHRPSYQTLQKSLLMR